MARPRLSDLEKAMYDINDGPVARAIRDLNEGSIAQVMRGINRFRY